MEKNTLQYKTARLDPAKNHNMKRNIEGVHPCPFIEGKCKGRHVILNNQRKKSTMVNCKESNQREHRKLIRFCHEDLLPKRRCSVFPAQLTGSDFDHNTRNHGDVVHFASHMPVARLVSGPDSFIFRRAVDRNQLNNLRNIWAFHFRIELLVIPTKSGHINLRYANATITILDKKFIKPNWSKLVDCPYLYVYQMGEHDIRKLNFSKILQPGLACKVAKWGSSRSVLQSNFLMPKNLSTSFSNIWKMLWISLSHELKCFKIDFKKLFNINFQTSVFCHVSNWWISFSTIFFGRVLKNRHLGAHTGGFCISFGQPGRFSNRTGGQLKQRPKRLAKFGFPKNNQNQDKNRSLNNINLRLFSDTWHVF